jgi:VanZ family protein
LTISEPTQPSRSLTLWGVSLVCYWLLMLLAFHIPISKRLEDEARLPPNSDKKIHLLLYGGFGLLLSGTLDTYGRRRGRVLPVVAQAALMMIAATVYGYVDEVTQPFTGRRYDLKDFYADIIGAAAGIAAYHLLRVMGVMRRLGLEG